MDIIEARARWRPEFHVFVDDNFICLACFPSGCENKQPVLQRIEAAAIDILMLTSRYTQSLPILHFERSEIYPKLLADDLFP